MEKRIKVKCFGLPYGGRGGLKYQDLVIEFSRRVGSQVLLIFAFQGLIVGETTTGGVARYDSHELI